MELLIAEVAQYSLLSAECCGSECKTIRCMTVLSRRIDSLVSFIDRMQKILISFGCWNS